jgi:hypothetical protein
LAAASRELAARRNRHVWEPRIICRQFNQSAETNNGSKIKYRSCELRLPTTLVFSFAPFVLLLVAIVGFPFYYDPAGAWRKMTEQMSYFLDKTPSM